MMKIVIAIMSVCLFVGLFLLERVLPLRRQRDYWNDADGQPVEREASAGTADQTALAE